MVITDVTADALHCVKAALRNAPGVAWDHCAYARGFYQSLMTSGRLDASTDLEAQPLMRRLARDASEALGECDGLPVTQRPSEIAFTLRPGEDDEITLILNGNTLGLFTE